MNARRRLNAGYVQGSAVLAALVGLVFSSWLAFLTAWALLVLGNLLAGDIRPKRPKS